MSTLKERFALILARRPRLTQAGLAKACGVKQPSAAGWISGDSKTMKAESARRAALFIGCDRDWLASGIGLPNWTEPHPLSEGAHARAPLDLDLSHPAPDTAPLTANQVPVIGTLEMGGDNMFELRASADGKPIGTVPAYTNVPGSYAVRVFGDDLYPAVRHGACLVVEPNGHCTEGELVLLETVEGYFLVCELVSQLADAITFLPAKGGPRRTLARSRLAAMHPVLDVTAASRFKAAP